MSDQKEISKQDDHLINIDKKEHTILNISKKISKSALRYVDYSIDFIINEESKIGRSEIIQVARKPILFGLWVSFITFFVCGIWAAFAPINSAAVAQGIVTVETQRKNIQHLEGGIVKEILVKDGDIVKKGQNLIILDDTRAKTSLEASLVHIRSLKATQARLIAESEEKSEIEFPEDIRDSKDPDIIRSKNTQIKLFETKTSALRSKINSINNKIEQHKKSILSLKSQLKSNNLQLNYQNDQLKSIQQLVDNRQAVKSKLLEIQSRVASYEGNIGDLEAKIAHAYSAINGEEVDIITYKTEFLNNIIKELKDVQTQIGANEEEIKHKLDTLNRVNITAPQDGIVNNLQIHTVGGIIAQGGQLLLEIIPQNDQLIIDAQIKPEDIDLVHPGLSAKVKLLAYKSRTTPALEGLVTYISAETIPSRLEGGRPYYHAKITIDENQFAEKNLKVLKLYPGMPAQVFIVTGSRSLLRYILDPLIDSVRKAFRER